MNNKRLIPILIGLSFIWTVGVIILALGSHLIIHRFGPLPEQPIQFSHTLHVNNLNLDCLYCHAYAEKSIHATIPKAELCLECHAGDVVDRPEAKKLVAMLAAQNEVAWQRVYNVKDHVYFTHRVHTIIAKLKCQQCHGPIEDMTVAIRSSGGSSDRGFMEMGWCITCHKRLSAPRECITCHK